MTDLVLTGTCGVITGAASGIGRALAFKAAAEQKDLALADVDEAGLKVVAAELEAQGIRVLARRVDMASADAVEAFADEVFGWATGVVRLVFANAGIHGITDSLNPDLDLWHRVIGVNLFGPLHMARSFLPRLIAQGEPAQFAITGSQACFLPAPGMAPYSASKHAVWALADCLKVALAETGAPVGISLIAPGRAASGITLPQAEAMRNRGDEQAAVAYENSMADAASVAEVMLREAKRGAFWIIPAHENTSDYFKGRADAILAAMPVGAIEIAR